MSVWQSSNPALTNDRAFAEAHFGMQRERSTQASMTGVINKTTLLVVIAVTAGALAYAFIPASGMTVMISFLASMIVMAGVGFMMWGKPTLAPVLAPVYAVVEGLGLGLFTAWLDSILMNLESLQAVTATAAANAETVSLAMPAFLITVAATLAVLGLYSMRILKPTKKFQAVIATLTLGVMVTYGLSWLLAIFGVSIPFVSLGSAFQGGLAPLIGLGISVLFLGIASLTLVMDFARVEAVVAGGQPKYMEWYVGFGLLVTLAWMYYEAVKLVFRLYLLFGSRD